MKKELLAAGIILAACLPSISTEASTNRILISTPHSYSQNISNYTNITLGMAGRERKEQEAWDREKKRRGNEYESEKQERRDRERWERQEEKKREQENRHHKKIINVKTTAILNVSANGNSTLPNRAGKATKATLCKIKTAGDKYHLLFFSNEII